MRLNKLVERGGGRIILSPEWHPDIEEPVCLNLVGTIDIEPGKTGLIGVSCDEVLESINRTGYFMWPVEAK